MKLELGPDVLRSYKRLPYSAWHALAEFVDNSSQSYFNHKDELDAVYVREGERLQVSIIYDREGTGLIRIHDNAMGMNYAELTHALRIGVPPENTEGRSRYGLGMKMAACWYGNKWKLVTKRLGETTEYTVEVDVERVASGEAELAESVAEGLSADLHYTRIEITELNRRPQGRTLGKIRDFLAGMYRLDIASGVMTLSWQHTPLEGTLDLTFLKDPLGNDYKKSFEFTVNGKRAWGWVGVLDIGGRPKAGFAMVHNGRMIQTWPEAWHPEALYGQTQGSNDLVNQRLVGEINLDEFEVSHTKDDIHWMDNEEDLVQTKLREVCGEYRDVAKRTRKRSGLAPAAVQAAARALAHELQSAEMADLVDADPPEPEAVAADEAALISESDLTLLDFVASFPYRGQPVKVLGLLDGSKSANDPYVVSEATQPNRVVVVINMNHPHLSQIDENGLLNYFRHCTYDALAEWRARNQAQTTDPGTIKRLKDGFLRIAFDIEMHEAD